MYSVHSMKYYGEKKLVEKNVPEPFKDIPDDFLQVKNMDPSWKVWMDGAR